MIWMKDIQSDRVMAFQYMLYAEIYIRGWHVYQGIELKRFKELWWAYIPEKNVWMISNSPFLQTATFAYYNAEYHRIDQAIAQFRNGTFNPEDQSWLTKFEIDYKKRFEREWEMFIWGKTSMIL